MIPIYDDDLCAFCTQAAARIIAGELVCPSPRCAEDAERTNGDFVISLVKENGMNEAEQRLWKDAYHIAWIGACNPRGVEFTIMEYVSAGFDVKHPAIQAMQGHLDFLNGTSLGPETSLLLTVRNVYLDNEERNYEHSTFH